MTHLEAFLRRKGLTQRQCEVIMEVTSCDPYRVVAERLFISEKAVKWHVTTINRRFKLKSRAELLVFVAEPMARDIKEGKRVELPKGRA